MTKSISAEWSLKVEAEGSEKWLIMWRPNSDTVIYMFCNCVCVYDVEFPDSGL